MVGVIGFEPTTPSSRTRCATRLRYTPTCRWPRPRRGPYSRLRRTGQGLRQGPVGVSQDHRDSATVVAAKGACIYGPRAHEPIHGSDGASPSGKAADFDSAMRRFESSRPSHSLFTPRSLFLHAVLVCETGAAMRVRDASPRNISLENRFERRMIEISVAGKIFSSMIQVVVV